MAFLLTLVYSAAGSIVVILSEKSRKGRKGRQQKKRPTAFLADVERTISFYSVFSKIYDQVNKYFYTSVMRAQIVCLANPVSGDLVLDAGCGTGYTTQALIDKIGNGQVVALDLTPEQLKKAIINLRTKRGSALFVRGDVGNLPFRSGTFDAIVSAGAVEYFPEPDRSILEMARAVKPGGRVVVAGPEGSWFMRVHLDSFFYAPSPQELRTSFVSAGLVNIMSMLTGVDTHFGTSNYVVVMVGEKRINV